MSLQPGTHIKIPLPESTIFTNKMVFYICTLVIIVNDPYAYVVRIYFFLGWFPLDQTNLERNINIATGGIIN